MTQMTMTKPKPYRYSRSLDQMSPNLGAEILRYGWSKPDILSLGQGESDFPTPDFIQEATVKAMAAGHTTYAPVLGVPALRSELSNYYSRVYELDVPENRIFVTGSASTAQHLCMSSILDEDDEVLTVTPIWKNLLGAIDLSLAKKVEVPLDYESEKGWSLDLDKLFAARTEKTKAMLIVSPSNPTGWCITREEIQAILEFAREHNIWIISDEVYSRIVFDEEAKQGVRALSFLDVADPEDPLFVINSFSKTWSMTGWRLGWIVGPAAAEPKILDVSLHESMGPCNFTQYGAVAALQHGEPFIEQQLTLWKSNRDLIAERFAQNDRIDFVRPAGAFYAFFRVDGENDCMSLCRRLIDEELLSLGPGISFGKCSKGFIRLSFAASEEKVVDALDRIDRVIG